MALTSRIVELQKKHANLSDTVDRLQKNPAIDDLQKAAMKKQKLRLKEEIRRLSDQ